MKIPPLESELSNRVKYAWSCYRDAKGQGASPVFSRLESSHNTVLAKKVLKQFLFYEIQDL